MNNPEGIRKPERCCTELAAAPCPRRPLRRSCATACGAIPECRTECAAEGGTCTQLVGSPPTRHRPRPPPPPQQVGLGWVENTTQHPLSSMPASDPSLAGAAVCATEARRALRGLTACALCRRAAEALISKFEVSPPPPRQLAPLVALPAADPSLQPCPGPLIPIGGRQGLAAPVSSGGCPMRLGRSLRGEPRAPLQHPPAACAAGRCNRGCQRRRLGPLGGPGGSGHLGHSAPLCATQGVCPLQSFIRHHGLEEPAHDLFSPPGPLLAKAGVAQRAHGALPEPRDLQGLPGTHPHAPRRCGQVSFHPETPARAGRKGCCQF